MSLRSRSLQEQRLAFDGLCAWVMAHLDEPIGWLELMRESGLEFLAIRQLFLRYTGMSPMMWIRRQRASRAQAPVPGLMSRH